MNRTRAGVFGLLTRVIAAPIVAVSPARVLFGEGALAPAKLMLVPPRRSRFSWVAVLH